VTEQQAIIKGKIEAAVKSANCKEIVHRVEWLGYLPFGTYHWIECAGSDVQHMVSSSFRVRHVILQFRAVPWTLYLIPRAADGRVDLRSRFGTTHIPGNTHIPETE
jgi:hypothetical protein